MGDGPDAVRCSTMRSRWAARLASGTSAPPTGSPSSSRGLSLDDTEVLVRSLTRWFQLVNLAEDNERVRRLRARDAADPERPRAGSLRHVVADAARGRSDGGGARRGARRRRAAPGDDRPSHRGAAAHDDRQAGARVRASCASSTSAPHAPAADARRRLLATVQELWGSDDLRAAELTVADEVRGGLIHFSSTLADADPADLPRPRGGDRGVLPRDRRTARRRPCRRCSASDRGSAATGTATRSSPPRRRWRRWS